MQRRLAAPGGITDGLFDNGFQLLLALQLFTQPRVQLMDCVVRHASPKDSEKEHSPGSPLRNDHRRPKPVAVRPVEPAAAFNCSRLGGAPSLNSRARSEEHTSELQSLMRISYAVFC